MNAPDKELQPAPEVPGPLGLQPDPPPAPVSSHHGLMGRIRNYFLTGLILVGPVYITLNLTWWFINWVDELVRPLTHGHEASLLLLVLIAAGAFLLGRRSGLGNRR